VSHAEDTRSEIGVSIETAERIAQTMLVLATPSRVRLLALLRDGPLTVGELERGVDMEQSAVSQQLRVLRNLGLVVGRRQGRHVQYVLHDPHIAALLDEAIGHSEHLTDPPGHAHRTPDSTRQRSRRG
jgi:DNA-binding transcriptional ArsR family regulator